ncbi:MAG: RecX family transcriptional regulator [Bryobacteraceae bacterium]
MDTGRRLSKMATGRKPKKLSREALWNYALRALGSRPHSAGELRQKLAQRAESSDDVDAAMAKLREYGFADDQKFSEAFAAGRLENRGFGRFRVLRDLRSKRIAPLIAELAVQKAFADTDEQDLIQRFLEKKYRGKDLTAFLNQEKNLANAYRRLRTAGFTSSGSLSVLRRYAQQTPEWTEAPEDE